MRLSFPMARMAGFLIVVALAGCSGAANVIPQSGSQAESRRAESGVSGQAISVTPTMLTFASPSAPAQTITASENFAGTITAGVDKPGVCSVSPTSQTVAVTAGTGSKAAQFQVSPVSPGNCTVTLTDKKANTATVAVTVKAATHAVIVLNGATNQIDEFAATASGNASPSRVLKAALAPRGVAYDLFGNLYVTSFGVVDIFAPGSATPLRDIRGNATQLNCGRSTAIDDIGEIFVMNCGNVLVFAPGTNGNVPPVRTLNIPNGRSYFSIAVDTASNLYVYDPDTKGFGQIEVFNAGASGNASPSRVITSSAINGGASGGIAVDAAGNIFVYNSSFTSPGEQIVEFAASASGNSSPINVINTGPCPEGGLALDGLANIWAVNTCNGPGSITEYAVGSTGNASPFTQFRLPGVWPTTTISMAIDATGNPHVPDIVNDVVYGFPRNSSGTVSPSSTVSLGVPGAAEATGLFLGGDGKVYVASPQGEAGQLVVYSSFVAGSPTPQRTIGAVPDVPRPRGVVVDAQGTAYLTSNNNGGIIYVFGYGASGGAQPLRTINGPATGLSQPTQIAFDRNGNLVVANQGNNSVAIYAASASGNAAPLAVISGTQTAISQPNGVAVDAAGFIYVGNNCCNGVSVNVFAPGVTGNVTPVRSIASAGGVKALQVDSGDFLYVLGGAQVQVFAPGASGNAQPSKRIRIPSEEGGFWTGLAVEP